MLLINNIKGTNEQMQVILGWQKTFLETVHGGDPGYSKNSVFISSCQTHCEGENEPWFSNLCVSHTKTKEAIMNWWTKDEMIHREPWY